MRKPACAAAALSPCARRTVRPWLVAAAVLCFAAAARAAPVYTVVDLNPPGPFDRCFGYRRWAAGRPRHPRNRRRIPRATLVGQRRELRRSAPRGLQLVGGPPRRRRPAGGSRHGVGRKPPEPRHAVVGQRLRLRRPPSRRV